MHNQGSFLITNSVLSITEISIFSNNSDKKQGGAITSIRSKVHLISNNSKFLNNSANFGGAISAYESEIHMHGKVRIVNNTAHANGGGVYLYQSELVCQDKCIFQHNVATSRGGGIHAFSSLIILGSKVWRLSGLKHNLFLVADNEASNGGGLSLEANSRIYGIGEYGYGYKFNFSGNHATKYGGAIFVDDYTNDDICTSNCTRHLISTECFFQTLYYTPKESIVFCHNHARISGHTLFGGLLDRCTVSVFAHVHEDKYQITGTSKQSTNMSGLEYFQNVTNVDVETVDSDATRICFCVNGEHNRYCDIDLNNLNVTKGEAFNITLVAVNQVLQPVTAKIITKIQSSEGHLNGTQYERNISNTCTNLTFNIYSPGSTDSLIIYAEGPCREHGISQSKVDVIFKECKCPLGFESSAC